MSSGQPAAGASAVPVLQQVPPSNTSSALDVVQQHTPSVQGVVFDWFCCLLPQHAAGAQVVSSGRSEAGAGVLQRGYGALRVCAICACTKLGSVGTPQQLTPETAILSRKLTERIGDAFLRIQQLGTRVQSRIPFFVGVAVNKYSKRITSAELQHLNGYEKRVRRAKELRNHQKVRSLFSCIA